MSPKKTKKERDPNKPKMPGGITGKGYVPGQSGNPGGRPKKFETLLSDAIRAELASIPEGALTTNASLIAAGMVKAAVKLASKGKLNNALLTFFKESRDSTEGKPAQKILIDGVTPTDPEQRIDVVTELLARSAERISREFDGK